MDETYGNFKAKISVDGYFKLPDLPRDIVGYWNLDEHVKDLSGNNLHGIVYGGELYSEARDGGKSPGKSFDFNSKKSINVVDDSDDSPLDVTFVTLSVWFYPVPNTIDSTYGHEQLINKENVFEIALKRDTMTVRSAASGCWRFWGETIVEENTWSHFTASFDGVTQRHYLNGKLVEETACVFDALAKNDEDLRIGARGGDGANVGVLTYASNFIGRIDDVMMYNRVLDHSEVNDLFLRKPDINRMLIGLTDGESIFGYQRLENNQVTLLTGPMRDTFKKVMEDSETYNYVSPVKYGGNTNEFSGRVTWGGSKAISYVVDNGNAATTTVTHQILNERVPNGKENDLKLVVFGSESGYDNYMIRKITVTFESAAPQNVRSFAFAFCQHDRLRWVDRDSAVKTFKGDGNGGSIDCGADKVIAFGFALHHSSARGTKLEKACLRENNKPCTVGSQICSQKACRQGGQANRDISFIYAVCQPRSKIPFSTRDMKFNRGDGKRQTNIRCPGKKLPWAVGFHHSNDFNTAISGSSGRRRLRLKGKFHPLSNIKLSTIQNATFEGQIKQHHGRHLLGVTSKWVARTQACFTPSQTSLYKTDDIFIWINANTGNVESGCVNSAFGNGNVCGWSILIKQESTGDITTLTNADREYMTGNVDISPPDNCVNDGDGSYWHRFGPVNLLPGSYLVAYENVGDQSIGKWVSGPTIKSGGALGSCAAPNLRFRDIRISQSSARIPPLVARLDSWYFYKLKLSPTTEVVGSNIITECKKYGLKALCSSKEDYSTRSGNCQPVSATVGIAADRFWSQPNHFDELWPNAPAGTKEKFYAASYYAANHTRELAKYNTGTNDVWTEENGSPWKGGNIMCVSATPISNHKEFFVENIFAAPIGSQADTCISQEKYDTDGDDVVFMFGVCLDEVYFNPMETISRSGLNANSVSLLDIIAYDMQGNALPNQQINLATSKEGRPGVVPVDFVATSGGHIELGWKDPPNDHGGKRDAVFEYSIFVSNKANAIRGIPEAASIDGMELSMDAAAMASYARDTQSVWKDTVEMGQELSTSNLQLYIDPARGNLGQPQNIGNGYSNLYLATNTKLNVENQFNCFESPVGGGGNSFDTGFRTDGQVVYGHDSFTVTAWIYKSHDMTDTEWHIFGDGNNGAFLKIASSGRFESHMRNPNRGRFSPNSDIHYGNFNWNDMSYGWHSVTITYTGSSGKQISLYIDGSKKSTQSNRRLDYWYKFRSFFGPGYSSGNSNLGNSYFQGCYFH
jgi:hypothetical protein